MINTFVGNFGHLATLIAFVSALVTAFAYSQYFGEDLAVSVFMFMRWLRS